MNRCARIGMRLAWGLTLLAFGALPARGDWTVSLYESTRGLQDVTLTSDDAGGVLVRRVELEEQIYRRQPEAGHAGVDGARPPGWSTYDLPTSFNQDTDVAPDGTGGAFFAVAGGGLASYHYRADGTQAAGVALFGSGPRDAPRAVTDGAGGAFVAWRDLSNGTATATAYLLRIGVDANIAPGWPAGGKQLGTWPTGGDGMPVLRPDGNGGVIVGLVGTDV